MESPFRSTRCTSPRPTLTGWALLCVALTLAGAPDCRAQTSDIDFSAVIDELWIQTPEADALTFVWWLPPEYWALDELELSEEELADIQETVRPYAIFIVGDGYLGPFGGATFVPPEEVIQNVHLVDGQGRLYEPLSVDSIDADTRAMIAMMGPLFKQMLGPMGENMTFALFEAETPEGRRIADPLTEDQFSVQVGDRSFTWETPLGSMLPPRYCPVDGRKLSGAWRYCPWHGDELRSEP